MVPSLALLGGLIFGSLNASAAIVINEGLDNSGINSPINGDGNKAVNFVMGAGDDYTLTTIVLGLDEVAGANPRVELWSDDGTSAPIGSRLETLDNPATLVDGANTFTSTVGTTLQASTTYWVVVGHDAGGFEWLGGTDTAVTSDIGATHDARLFGTQGAGPGNWTGTSGVLNQIQVNADVIPEPNSAILLGLAGSMLLVRRRR